MGPNYIALAVPAFMALIALELWLLGPRRKHHYRFADAVTSMGCGIAQQLVMALVGGAVVSVYAAVHDRFRLLTLPGGRALTWLAAFVAVDFAYYWWHRMSHEVNVLWAAHIVHHQSEDYNLSTALRQSVFTAFTALPFNLPLALLGVPVREFIAASAFNALYQFWIHTELLGTLGAAERWLNTPAHHRVHHAINPPYIDKNYGGILISWDRLFGTFAAETEAPVYGLVKPFKHFDALWSQLHYFAELLRDAFVTPRFADKLRVFAKGPSWHAPGTGAAAVATTVSRERYLKHGAPVPAALRWYLGVQFAALIAATFVLMQWGHALALRAQLAGTVACLAALGAWGALLDRRRYAVALEIARVGLTAALLLWLVRR